MSLALGLKAARQRAGLNSREAAERLSSAGKACSCATLLNWERGKGKSSREPSASDLALIARTYGCTIAELFRFAEADMQTVSDALDASPADDG